jgi:hypothetical protein
MALKETTIQEIKRRLEQIQEVKKNKINHTDCDWIFNDVKDMIENAVKNNVSLSDIVKCITVSNYTDRGGKKLKVTGAKLAVWLKANGIARTVHKRKSRKTKKESM